MALFALPSNKTIMIFGAPMIYNNALYNCAMVAQNGKLLGIVPKCSSVKDTVFADGRDIFGKVLWVLFPTDGHGGYNWDRFGIVR